MASTFEDFLNKRQKKVEDIGPNGDKLVPSGNLWFQKGGKQACYPLSHHCCTFGIENLIAPEVPFVLHQQLNLKQRLQKLLLNFMLLTAGAHQLLRARFAAQLTFLGQELRSDPSILGWTYYWPLVARAANMICSCSFFKCGHIQNGTITFKPYINTFLPILIEKYVIYFIHVCTYRQIL